MKKPSMDRAEYNRSTDFSDKPESEMLLYECLQHLEAHGDDLPDCFKYMRDSLRRLDTNGDNKQTGENCLQAFKLEGRKITDKEFARSMRPIKASLYIDQGHTQAEAAEFFGVSDKTIQRDLKAFKP